MEKELLETEKIQLEIEQLQAKGKIAEMELLKSELESGKSDEWEDIENDSSEHDEEQKLPTLTIKQTFTSVNQQPKKYKQVKADAKKEDQKWQQVSENNYSHISLSESKSPSYERSSSSSCNSEDKDHLDYDNDHTPPYDDEEDYSSEHDHDSSQNYMLIPVYSQWISFMYKNKLQELSHDDYFSVPNADTANSNFDQVMTIDS